MGENMYEIHEKIRDPIKEIFMEIDKRIENALELTIKENNIPTNNIQRLIIDKKFLLTIIDELMDEEQIEFDKIWDATNLIYKIDYILEESI